jgi:exopolyphosphatase/guanosine-5'-triphosphate,3'-diphosphate pyrophosphatase
VNSSAINDRLVEVGQRHGFDLRHALQVSRLATRLFDDLQPLHAMGNTERIWLRAAAMLHDVGKARAPSVHHKVARDVIIRSANLPFRREERLIIGLTARYHRGSLPETRHRYFRRLDAYSRLCVRKLAALLRIADGLDKGHADLVEDLQCEVRPRSVLIRVAGRDRPTLTKALKKADLFEEVFGRQIVICAEVLPRLQEFELDSDRRSVYAEAG